MRKAAMIGGGLLLAASLRFGLVYGFVCAFARTVE